LWWLLSLYQQHYQSLTTLDHLGILTIVDDTPHGGQKLWTEVLWACPLLDHGHASDQHVDNTSCSSQWVG
jgi:hypothetical protein